jgi:hypothetical protein
MHSLYAIGIDRSPVNVGRRFGANQPGRTHQGAYQEKFMYNLSHWLGLSIPQARAKHNRNMSGPFAGSVRPAQAERALELPELSSRRHTTLAQTSFCFFAPWLPLTSTPVFARESFTAALAASRPSLTALVN